jgi:hypothetical protein
MPGASMVRRYGTFGGALPENGAAHSNCPRNAVKSLPSAYRASTLKLGLHKSLFFYTVLFADEIPDLPLLKVHL